MRLATDQFWAVATIYGEARGEVMDGKVAVGCAIRNRMKAGKNVMQVVLEPLQFSCWNSHDPNRVPMAEIDDADPVVVECTTAWLWSATSDITGGATHYLSVEEAKNDPPSWYTPEMPQVVIGRQIFLTAP